MRTYGVRGVRFPGQLALCCSDLPADLRLLSSVPLPHPVGRRRGTLPALQFASLCGALAFVREPLPLVSGKLPRVGQTLALVRDLVPLVSGMFALRGGFLPRLRRGGLAAGICELSALGVLLRLAPRLSAVATLDLALLRCSIAPVRQPLTFVGCEFPHIRQPLALVRDPLALVRDPLALVRESLAPFDGRRTLVQALSSPLEPLGQVLAPEGQPLTLGGKLLPLLGDVLALRGDSLAFASHPEQLARLVRDLLRLPRARSKFSGRVSVRVHRDRTSFERNSSLTR